MSENISSILPSDPDHSFLNKKTFFAELETDRRIRECYFPDYSYAGTMIEVGGATPDYISMSKHFKLNGWRAIVIEPNPNFVILHEQRGNEVYQCACSNEDRDDVSFQVVNWVGNKDYQSQGITDHSFSSIQVKDGYLKKHNYNSVEDLNYTEIKVKVRRLDTLLRGPSSFRVEVVLENKM